MTQGGMTLFFSFFSLLHTHFDSKVKDSYYLVMSFATTRRGTDASRQSCGQYEKRFWDGTAESTWPDYDGVNGATFIAACSSGLSAACLDLVFLPCRCAVSGIFRSWLFWIWELGITDTRSRDQLRYDKLPTNLSPSRRRASFCRTGYPLHAVPPPSRPRTRIAQHTPPMVTQHPISKFGSSQSSPTSMRDQSKKKSCSNDTTLFCQKHYQGHLRCRVMFLRIHHFSGSPVRFLHDGHDMTISRFRNGPLHTWHSIRNGTRGPAGVLIAVLYSASPVAG